MVLARLDSTTMILEKIVTYMLDTHTIFIESGGFMPEMSWYLLTQLVNHIFVDGMKKV